MPQRTFSALGRVCAAAFNLVLPDECRLCQQRLKNVSNIPVCPSCLALPAPIHAEFSCGGCGTAFLNPQALNERGLCAFCQQGGLSFDASFSFGSYEGALRSLIHLFKYSKVESLGQPLGRFLLKALPIDAKADLVIPMPMHWRKRWQRGFNQADLLAAEIAKARRLPLSRELRRTRTTKAQAGLTGEQRKDNLKDSFAVRHPLAVSGKRILLVDDVMTTGATLRAASQVLKAAGALHICALTLARVDRAMLELGAQSLAKASGRTTPAAVNDAVCLGTTERV